MQKSSKDKVSFEKALKQLEEIVNKLESGDLGLEDSLELFEEGIKLSRFCSKKLELAEKKIEMLTKDEKGENQIIPADIE
ncbi:MAG: exodeoxyribonuclease VII small subunit [bacterium]